MESPSPASAPPGEIAKTPLNDLHRQLGAKMVPFAGYDMPVQYETGILKEHVHTRTAAGLFDVSHMGQIRLSGTDRATALERLVPVDVIDLPAGRQRYALFTGENAGILDDLMIANAGDHLFLVVNAACKTDDYAHLQRHLDGADMLADQALLALQGPAAAAVLAEFNPAITSMRFMDARAMALGGLDCWVSRSGYTGEDGFEISLPGDAAEDFAKKLLAHAAVKPIGLGARDSLRLEAGLCLYGHDMDTETTPVEAALTWSISKIRRPGGARAGGYPGAEVIAHQLSTGVARKRVGLRPGGRAPIREGVTLHAACDAADDTADAIGRVTSGGFGPTVGGPVAMGYVATASSAPGTELVAKMRGRSFPVTVAKTPFVPPNFAR